MICFLLQLHHHQIYTNWICNRAMSRKVDPYPFSNPVTLKLTLVTALPVDINRLTNVVIVKSRNITNGLFKDRYYWARIFFIKFINDMKFWRYNKQYCTMVKLINFRLFIWFFCPSCIWCCVLYSRLFNETLELWMHHSRK
jgi:hypothetical protein